jgi:phosphoenolpyruvate carboxylase
LSTVTSELLRRDVHALSEKLGEAITAAAGAPALALVEDIRKLARGRRSNDPCAEQTLSAIVAALDLAQIETVLRAFTVFFDLANLAEDRERVRVLRSREKLQEVPRESIAAAIAELKRSGFDAGQMQEALSRLSIDLVFTAHPSEAKRRAIRAKLRRMREYIRELDREDLIPRERGDLEDRLRTEIAVLWQTAFLRPHRPTVLEEVERCLSIAPRLWSVVPQIHESLRRALEENYPGHVFHLPAFLRFGSWVGGDRDGHPDVSVEITAATLKRMREKALSLHLAECRRMYDFLSLSTSGMRLPATLEARLSEALEKWPDLSTQLVSTSSSEFYRRFVAMVEWRLEASLERKAGAPSAAGYRDGCELLADLDLILKSLREVPAQHRIACEVERWVDCARVFGLHLASLDIRQDSRRHTEVLTEVFAILGLAQNFDALPEDERLELLSANMPSQASSYAQIIHLPLSPNAKETLGLFRLLQATISSFGPAAIGSHVVSLTQSASDVMAVLWLWRWASAMAGDFSSTLRVSPLFEKIGDLQSASKTLSTLLSQPKYVEHLALQGNRQMVTVGYSDSTKDGGYLSACWGLYRAQNELHAAGRERGIQVTFFHGRGGSLGRGGGPAARGIRSLPPGSMDGSLRLTEQGEVLAERYDDVQIAYRHLEQVTWATLLTSAAPTPEPPDNWIRILENLSERSYQFYRQLVDQPGFLEYFSNATPIEEIEDLPIGSRPARRRGRRNLSDLRAIPWVFSWTQNRCMIPAWYGLGWALEGLKQEQPEIASTLGEMYRSWPFFEATIENASIALAKTDMYIAQRYAQLHGDPAVRERISSLIESERNRSRQAILEITGEAELLARTPWFQGSIRARVPYIDLLNLIQIELLQRRRARPVDAPESERDRVGHLLRLTLQGIAAGIRTTG